MTPIHKRELPDGFQLEWDDTTWNVGHLFRWSEFYESFLCESCPITVRPGDTLPEAYERVFGCKYLPEWEIFFKIE